MNTGQPLRSLAAALAESEEPTTSPGATSDIPLRPSRVGPLALKKLN